MNPMYSLVWHVGNSTIKAIRGSHDSAAVIAGGWAYDCLLGRCPRDVDVWMTKRISGRDLVALFPDLTDYRYYGEGIDQRLRSVTKIRIRGIEVDFMEVNTEYLPNSESIVASFDFNICQAYSTGDGSIYGSAQFWGDAHGLKITYNQTDYNDINLHRIVNVHLPKLMRKFPDHRVANLTRPILVPTWKRILFPSTPTRGEIPLPCVGSSDGKSTVCGY